MGVIYKITNTVNNKVYVGQTRRTFEQRKKQHLKSFKEQKTRTALINSVISHGVDKFIFNIIEECNDDNLDEREIFYINEYNSIVPNGYNIQLGGRRIYTVKNKNTNGRSVCQYTIDGDFINEFKSASHAETYTTIDSSRILKCCHNKAISSGKFRWSFEKLEKLEPIVIDYSKYIPHIAKRNVYQFDLNGKILNMFLSIKEASEKTSTSVDLIRHCISGQSKTTHKLYQWSYEENKEKIVLKGRGMNVYKYNKDGLLLEEFTSIKDAVENTNITRNSLTNYLKNNTKDLLNDFIWSFEKKSNIKSE